MRYPRRRRLQCVIGAVCTGGGVCCMAGVPTGLCAEGPAGVFSRVWSAGTAALDCNGFTADLPFPRA